MTTKTLPLLLVQQVPSQEQATLSVKTAMLATTAQATKCLESLLAQRARKMTAVELAQLVLHLNSVFKMSLVRSSLAQAGLSRT